jgi:hypothetical protein
MIKKTFWSLEFKINQVLMCMSMESHGGIILTGKTKEL